MKQGQKQGPSGHYETVSTVGETLRVFVLDSVRQTSRWEPWLDFFLEGVLSTTTGAVDTAHQLIGLFKADTQRIEALGRAAANILRVFDALRQRPRVTINDLVARTGISYRQNSVQELPEVYRQGARNSRAADYCYTGE